MVVCDKSGIKDDGIHTSQFFVTEITSETTRKYDYGRKMLTYSDIGVKEYWVVDLERRVVVLYLRDNEYMPEIFSYPDITEIKVYTYPLLEINLSDIFE